MKDFVNFLAGIVITLGLLGIVYAFHVDALNTANDLQKKAAEVCECHGGLDQISPAKIAGEPQVICKDGQTYDAMSYAVFTCSEGK